jgi:biopolymer transport protein ExbD
MSRIHGFYSTVPRRIDLTGRRVKEERFGVIVQVRPLSFVPMAWLLFLFGWIVFEIFRIWFVTGFSWASTGGRGLDMALPERTVTAAELSRLEEDFAPDAPAVDSNGDRYVVLDIDASGQVLLDGETIDLDRKITWARTRTEARETIVFVHPLQGTTYGDVVTVLDQLRRQPDISGFEIARVELVSCGGTTASDEAPPPPE